MSNCIKNNCKLCDRLIISQSITFTDGTLVVNLPQQSFNNNCKYCIIFAQNIPDTATINAPVEFSIGTGETTYPFLNSDCTQILASQIRTRRKYKVCVSTSATTGAFKYIGNCCLPSNSTIVAQSIPVTSTPT